MASILDRYGIKEVADVVFYELGSDGNPTKPVLYLDTLKVSTIEQTAEQAEARGGKGNPPLIIWDYVKEINVTLEDALFSAKSMAIMFGNGSVKNYSGSSAYIMRTEEFIATASDSASGAGWKSTYEGPDGTTYTKLNGKFYTAAGDTIASTATLTKGEKYFCSYDLLTKDAGVIVISAASFPGTYYVTGDTYARSEASGKDEFLQFIEAVKDRPVTYAIFMTLYYTGMREGELLALTPADIDLEKQTVRINKGFQRLKGRDRGLVFPVLQQRDGALVCLVLHRAAAGLALLGGVQMAGIATQLMLGETVKSLGLDKRHVVPYFGVKEAVLPFNMFPEVDPILGPEMRSTGEVLGLAATFGEAFYKAQEATQTVLPLSGTVLMSVNDRDKEEAVEAARNFEKAGFEILATGGTYDTLREAGIEAKRTLKLSEGRPNLVDAILNGTVDLVINTPSSTATSTHDGTDIRKSAIKMHIPYMTTIAAGKATALGILDVKDHASDLVKSLQEIHAGIER